MNKLRAELTSSPYRDDIPHITLLRSINSPTLLGDDELLKSIAGLVETSSKLPMTARIIEVANKSNELYSSSGLILLEVSPELASLRKKIIEYLTAHSYTVEQQEIERYTPHMTIRLGVPLEGEMMQKAQEVFPADKEIIFNRWLLFRLVKKDNTRLMRVVMPAKDPM